MCKRTIVSECVTDGHPDKIADAIADEILEALNSEDKNVRAGIEVMVKDNIVVLGGEISTVAKSINYDEIVRNVYRELRFPEWHGLEPDNIKVVNLIGKQSPEIHSGVDRDEETIGAGDQGFVCGFATNETPAYLGLGHYIAKKICAYIETQKFIGPDAKSQVIVEYDENGTAEIKSILVSAMHYGDYENVKGLRNKIRYVINENEVRLDDGVFKKYIAKGGWKLDINPCGKWHVGGPVSDCGVTGRKIVVDQYGGYCKVGGGALVGKDMTKVDRSAAYMCRYLAKNIVASGIADTAKVELSYMIGVPEPLSVYVWMNRNIGLQDEVIRIIKDNVDLTPYGIIKRFGNVRGRYDAIAKLGHYGVPEIYGFSNKSDSKIYELYPWEKTDISGIFQ
jgi:S-adenosylmethionine synthetase